MEGPGIALVGAESDVLSKDPGRSYKGPDWLHRDHPLSRILCK